MIGYKISMGVLIMPLMAYILANVGYRFIGSRGASILCVGSVGLSALLSLWLYVVVGLSGKVIHIKVFPWLNTGFINIWWGFLFDSVTCVMLVVVCIVSSLVHIYSLDYMKEDPFLNRFMSYLSLFTFFMLVLVTADNMLQMFVGWEGVGVVSYLLVNFWFTRLQANKSAVKAMLVNRVGDFFLSIGIVLALITFKSVDYGVIFGSVPLFGDVKMVMLGYELNVVTLICVCIFIGAVAKSAQLGLHTWLPDAMEGPTPVSALIHAATMVTAGVFALIRCCVLLEYAPKMSGVLMIFGGLTALFGSSVALVQNDMKRVIAYSTCSQLGYMVLACGMSNYSGSLFHLMNHAFFKALLFLSAGSVIHALADEQDIRRMGGLVKVLPFTYMMILIGSVALIGVPFLSGFYSKDMILEVSYAGYHGLGWYGYTLGTLSACFTAIYSVRLIYFVFFGKVNGYRVNYEDIHDAPRYMGISLFTLAILSMIVGYIGRDMTIGLGTDFWSNSIIVRNADHSIMDYEYVPYWVKITPVMLGIVCGGLSLVYGLYFSKYFYRIGLLQRVRLLYGFLNRKWYFDIIYNGYITRLYFYSGYEIGINSVDKGAMEIIGPYGMVKVGSWLSSRIGSMQSGYLYHYMFLMILGLVGIIWLGSYDIQLVDMRVIYIWGALLVCDFIMKSKKSKIVERI